MPASYTSFIYGSIFYLVFAALVLPYCAYCLYRFISISKSNWNEKYFRHRHPISNILFLLCFFVATFIIDPLEVILGIIGYEDSSTLAIIDIIYDLTSVIIFAIFICRVWFLFSDWSFHYNMSSWIWKREINPLETNCIIKYRQIFGNKKCCYLFIFFIIFLPIIIMLDIIPFLFFPSDSNQILFRIAVVLLFIIFTLFILLSQLKRVLDVYNIRKELVYEICVYGALLLFSEIFSNLLLLTNIINHTQQILFLSILSLITNTLVIYIGTNWVLKQFQHYKLFQSIGQFQSTIVPHDQAAQKINTDDLITILNTEQGFESFLLHLVNELQLENMLFLIEVLQFKQEIKNRLLNMNVQDEYDKSSAEWLKLNYVLNEVTNNSAQHLQSDVLVLSQINIKELQIPCDPRLPAWSVYQFAVHLYDKYIEDGAALQLGLSSQCQRFIYSYFRARAMSPLTTRFPTPNDGNINSDELEDGAGNITTQKIVVLKDVDEDEAEEAELVVEHIDGGDVGDDELVTYSPARIIPDSVAEDAMDKIITGVHVDGVNGHGDVDQNVNVVYDLFRVYDNALYEVWNSISNQIFTRFKTTSEYGTIYERIYNINHIEQSNLINNSFNNKVQRKHLVHSNSISVN